MLLQETYERYQAGTCHLFVTGTGPVNWTQTFRTGPRPMEPDPDLQNQNSTTGPAEDQKNQTSCELEQCNQTITTRRVQPDSHWHNQIGTTRSSSAGLVVLVWSDLVILA